MTYIPFGPFVYSRTDLAAAIPDITPDTAGDGTEDERQEFAAGFNRVLDVLRSEYLPGEPFLSDAEITAAVFMGAVAWDHYCLRQGDVDRTVTWLRAEYLPGNHNPHHPRRGPGAIHG